jgi:adenine phosphoribosyltransferase
VIEKAGATTAREVGILTEGNRAEWRDILSLGHLPLFYGPEKEC